MVGAGPAGATTARFAAARGLKVLLLDKRREIGVPVQCGEFMAANEEVTKIFPKAGEVETLYKMPESLKEVWTERIRIVSPMGKGYDIPFKGYTVSRAVLDKHWVALAEKEGAELQTGVTVSRVKDSDVETTRGSVQGKVVVAADGPWSAVARSVGLNPPRELAVAITCIVEGDFDPIVKIFFGSLAPGGYAWIIPKNGCANVGLGVWHWYEGKITDLFLEFLQKRGFATDGWTGGWVPEMGAVERTVKDNVILVGDAAGHVMPTNGGGVNLAMICARIAGNCIADHVLHGEPLENYEEMWRDVAGEVLETGIKIKRLANLLFLSDFWLDIAMRLMGPKRMDRAIRCQRLFTPSIGSRS